MELLTKRNLKNKTSLEEYWLDHKIRQHEDRMNYYFNETKNVKDLVKFTRLENKRHEQELQYIQNHLMSVAPVVQEISFLQSLMDSSEEMRLQQLMRENDRVTRYIRFLTSTNIEVHNSQE